MADLELPFTARFGFAFAAFFGILFDGRFARRLWSARELPPAQVPEPVDQHVPELADEPEKTVTGSESATEDGALLFLSLLQREGRLIDFLEQEIASFSDADVGAAARAVHEGARRMLRAHVTIAPVRTETEGTKITLETGFDAHSIKLTGNVRGAAPYVGTLKHPGWRAISVKLPHAVGEHDPKMLAPAEVEL